MTKIMKASAMKYKWPGEVQFLPTLKKVVPLSGPHQLTTEYWQPMLRAIFACSVEIFLQRNGQLKLISNKPSFYPSKKLDHNKTFFRQRLLGIISMTFANLCHDLILNSFIHRFCRFLCRFKTNVKLTILIFNFNPSCV